MTPNSETLDALISRWHQDTLADIVARAAPDAREAVEAAVADLPAKLAAAAPGDDTATVVYAWYDEHFRVAAVANDTALWNALHAATVELAARLNVLN